MSLQVWLPLNGDLKNNGLSGLSFSNSGTSTLIVSSSGKIGSCYERTTKLTAGYIGSDSTINLSGDITMCCWAYVMDCVGDTANGLVTNHSHSNNSGVGITVKQYSESNYRISCNTGNGSSRTFYTYYGTTNIKNSWHHLALTYSKVEQKLQLWVDGEVEYTLNNYANYSISDYIRIFEWSTSYDYTYYRPAARLNDVRIYDECLSVLDIKEIMKGLALYFPLNDPYIESSVNINTPNWSSHTPYWYIDSQSLDDITVRKNTSSSSSTVAIYNNNILNGLNAGETWTFSCYLYKGQTPYKASVSYLTPYDVFSSTTNIISREDGFFSATVVYNGSRTSSWMIHTKLFGTCTDGEICYIKQIQWEKKDHVTAYRCGIDYQTNLVYSLASGGQTTVSGTSIVTSGTSADTYFYLKLISPMILNHTYRISCMGSGITSGQYWKFPIAGQTNTGPGQLTIKNGYNELIFVANSTCVNAGVSVIMDDTARPSTMSVCTFSNIKLQDLSTGHFIDCSGSNINALIEGDFTISSNSPRNKYSTVFNGTNTALVCGRNAMCTDTITVAWWGYMDNWNNYTRAISCTESGGWNFEPSNGVMSFPIYIENIGYCIAYDNFQLSNIAPGWHHWAGTYDKTSINIYRDGVIVGTTSISSTNKIYYNQTNAIFIGAEASSSNILPAGPYFNGKLSDVRIYGTALSHNDILKLYNNPTCFTKDNKIITQGEFLEE